ncbi:hypothetical protein X943_001677 [Babesia divergens]|uniref:Uncharacterized protein n=1 Tax=Babesia divergens TaxID=32595 RepID=A0AAD9GFP8_BABDI|nr:hypothetical protein X943_001677 [Babesia divergens]
MKFYKEGIQQPIPVHSDSESEYNSVKPFFSSTGSCKGIDRGDSARNGSNSSCDTYRTEENSDREYLSSRTSNSRTSRIPKQDRDRIERYADKVERACKKYGITNQTIEDILSGKRSAERKQKAYQYDREECSHSDCSSDGFREEMLIYLLNEQVKLKAKLRAEKARSPKTTRRDTHVKAFTELKEMTHDEMKYINEMWERPGMLARGDDATEQYFPSCESSPKSYGSKKNPKAKQCDPVSDAMRQQKQDPVDLISHEASSLQDEIDELIGNLENTCVSVNDAHMSQNEYDCDSPQSNGHLYPNQHPYEEQNVPECENCEPEYELVKPIKVPLRPPKPELCDAQVLTDETAREHELQAYERLSRELDRRHVENERAHQTDNTRITKDGMSWEITESYLKEEERRMLQEKKRAELLMQLKKGPHVKTETLQDHYNKWIQRKAESQGHMEHDCAAKQVGEIIEPTEPENCEQTPSHAAPTTDKIQPKEDAKSVAYCRNVFRRNGGNKKSALGLNSVSGSNLSHESSRSEPINATWDRPADVPGQTDPDDAVQQNRDVYIKGTWNPRTGAIKISNDLDSPQNTDKNKMLDDYVNFLKQNPGNWSQEQEIINSGHAMEHNVHSPREDVHMKSDEGVWERHESDDEQEELDDGTDTSVSSPRSSVSSDSPRKIYERDEFYPPTTPLPMQSPYEQNEMPQRFAMGFRDPYLPHLRTAADLYSSSLTNMSLLQAPHGQMKSRETEHHHHYHYHCQDKHRRCGHKKRHSCRHKHTCSKRKQSSKKHLERKECVDVGSGIDVDEDAELLQPVGKPTIKVPPIAVNKVEANHDDGDSRPLTSMADMCVAQKQMSNESQTHSGLISSPSFGAKDKIRVQETGMPLPEDVSPVSISDIITGTQQVKSTDFVKVVTYHTPTETVEPNTSVEPEEDKLADEPRVGRDRSMVDCITCCAMQSEDAQFESLQDPMTPTTYQGSPSSRGNSIAGSATLSQIGEVPYGPRRRAEYRRQGPSENSTPAGSINNSPTRRYPHVFSRRTHSRNMESKTCISPLAKLEQLEACTQVQNANCKEICQYEYDSGVESGEQFTFRDTADESPQRDNSSPTYKTRLIYVRDS